MNIKYASKLSKIVGKNFSDTVDTTNRYVSYKKIGNAKNPLRKSDTLKTKQEMSEALLNRQIKNINSQGTYKGTINSIKNNVSDDVIEEATKRFDAKHGIKRRINGDRYRTSSKGATYKGKIDKENLELDESIRLKAEIKNNIKRKFKKAKNSIIEELPEEKRNNIIEKAFPYRVKGWVGASVVGGAATIGAINTGRDVYEYNTARGIGNLSYERMANQVGISPTRHSAQFVESIPADVYRSGFDKTISAIPFLRRDASDRMMSYDDGSASGDLVFAMHNLR